MTNAPVTDFVGRPSQGCSKFPTAEEKEKPPFYRLILNWKIEVQIQNVLIYIVFILRKFRRKSHRRRRGLGLAGPRPNNILESSFSRISPVENGGYCECQRTRMGTFDRNYVTIRVFHSFQRSNGFKSCNWWPWSCRNCCIWSKWSQK